MERFADWRLMVAMALVGWAISGFVGYSSTDKETAARITALEAHRLDDAQRLERIEHKVDVLYEKATGAWPHDVAR